VLRATADRWVHIIRLAGVGDVDDQVLAWLTEAYHAGGA
jgi:hypothetical protein